MLRFRAWSVVYFILEQVFFVAAVWNCIVRDNYTQAGFCVGMAVWFKLAREEAHRAATPVQHETKETP